MSWLNILKKSWDYTILYTIGEINVRNFNQGLGFSTAVDSRRDDIAIITIQIIPTAQSVKIKNAYFMNEFDSIKLEVEIFMSNYIKKFLPSSFEDHIAIMDMQLLTEDPITKFSLEKAAFKLKILEIQFSKDKDLPKIEADEEEKAEKIKVEKPVEKKQEIKKEVKVEPKEEKKPEIKPEIKEKLKRLSAKKSYWDK